MDDNGATNMEVDVAEEVNNEKPAIQNEMIDTHEKDSKQGMRGDANIKDEDPNKID